MKSFIKLLLLSICLFALSLSGMEHKKEIIVAAHESTKKKCCCKLAEDCTTIGCYGIAKRAGIVNIFQEAWDNFGSCVDCSFDGCEGKYKKCEMKCCGFGCNIISNFVNAVNVGLLLCLRGTTANVY